MLEWIISSAVLTAVVIVLRLLLKGKMSLRLQYALWAVVLVRLLVPVSFGSTAVSVQNFVERPAAERSTAREFSHISEALNDSVDYPLYMPQEVMETFYDAHVSDNVEYIEVGEAQNAAQPASESKAAEARSLTVNDILNIVWACGAGLIALWLLITNLHFYRKLRRSRERLEVEGAPLPVFVTDRIDTPCLFGLIRPKIYVTPEVAQDAAVLRYSIEHEATHRRHGDHIWAILRGLCLAVHWYNPLVWIAAILSRKDAELACDEATIKRIGEEHRADYGYTLLQLTCEKRPAIFVAATTMTGSGRSIKERIKLIVKKPKTAVITLIAIVLIVAIAVGCTFTGAKTGETTEDTEAMETPVDLGELDASDIPALLDAIDLREATLTFHSGDAGSAADTTCPADAAIRAAYFFEKIKQIPWQDCETRSENETRKSWYFIRLTAPHTTVTFYDCYYATDNKCEIHVETDSAEIWLKYPSTVIYKKIIEANALGETTSDLYLYSTFYSCLCSWFQGAYGATVYGGSGRLLTADELELFNDFTAAYRLAEDPDPDGENSTLILNLEISCFLTSDYSDVRDIAAQPFLTCLCAVDNNGRYGDYDQDGNRLYENRVSRARANEVLMKYAGVTVEEMHTDWFAEVTYDPDTDSFYPEEDIWSTRPGTFTPLVGVENGSAVTLWTWKSWEMLSTLNASGSAFFNPAYRMTLEKNGDGWRILSYTAEGAEPAQTAPTTEPDEPPAELIAAVESLCDSGDISLTLYVSLTRDSSESAQWETSYTGDAYTVNSLRQSIRNYNWTQLDAPSSEPSAYWLTAVSADGTKRMTFWDDGGAGTVEYSDGMSSSFWKASRVYLAGMSVAESVRSQFDRLETDFSRVSFRVDGTAEDAAEYFVTTAVGEHMRSLEPGNGFGVDDYEAVTWEVLNVSEDGRTVKGSFACAVVPRHPESVEIRAGNTREGTGQYAGKLVFDRTFVLELQDDGNWHCVEIGTG